MRKYILIFLCMCIVYTTTMTADKQVAVASSGSFAVDSAAILQAGIAAIGGLIVAGATSTLDIIHNDINILEYAEKAWNHVEETTRNNWDTITNANWFGRTADIEPIRNGLIANARILYSTVSGILEAMKALESLEVNEVVQDDVSYYTRFDVNYGLLQKDLTFRTSFKKYPGGFGAIDYYPIIAYQNQLYFTSTNYLEFEVVRSNGLLTVYLPLFNDNNTPKFVKIPVYSGIDNIDSYGGPNNAYWTIFYFRKVTGGTAELIADFLSESAIDVTYATYSLMDQIRTAYNDKANISIPALESAPAINYPFDSVRPMAVGADLTTPLEWNPTLDDWVLPSNPAVPYTGDIIWNVPMPRWYRDEMGNMRVGFPTLTGEIIDALTGSGVKNPDIPIDPDIPISPDLTGITGALGTLVGVFTTGLIGNLGDINWDKLKMTGNTLTTKFPFSIPWDIGNAFDSVFGSVSGADLPSWDWTVYGHTITIAIPDILIAWFPYIRGFILVLFDIGIIYAIRQWLGGAS